MRGIGAVCADEAEGGAQAGHMLRWYECRHDAALGHDEGGEFGEESGGVGVLFWVDPRS